MVHVEQNSRKIMRRVVDLLQNERMGENERVKLSLDLLGMLHAALIDDPIPGEEFELFRSNFSSLLSSGRNYAGLLGYVIECGTYAERGRLDGFAEACGMRSILQLLNDEFIDWNHVGSSGLKNAFTEDMEDIDETLEDVSDEAPPVREEEIPGWVPGGHWWWHAPKQQDMSDAGRKSRLEYDHLDGVYD
jgi:hypothetical protein